MKNLWLSSNYRGFSGDNFNDESEMSKTFFCFQVLRSGLKLGLMCDDRNDEGKQNEH